MRNMLLLVLLATVLATIGCAPSGVAINLPGSALSAVFPSRALTPTSSEPGLDEAAARLLAQTRVELSELRYYAMAGTLYFLGKVKNNGPADLASPAVVFTLLDEAGSPTVSESGPLRVHVLRPGESVYFQAAVNSSDSGKPLHGLPDRIDFRIELQADTLADVPDDAPVSSVVALGSTRVVRERGLYTVAGQVEVAAARAASDVGVIVAVFDAQGQLLGVQPTLARADATGETVLPAGSTGHFTASFFEFADLIDHYQVQVVQ